MLRLNVFIQVSADNRAAVMEAAKELVACALLMTSLKVQPVKMSL